jgi:rhodanese-related sulfurtransferase
MPKRKLRSGNTNTRSGLSAFLRKPAVQLGLIAFVVLVVYLIASAGGSGAGGQARDISVEEAYKMYQSGTFVVDVRRQDEWDAYHAPNTFLIPLDELPNRLNEIPKDQKVLVICHSGNRSKQGRDILVNAGYNAISINGGLLAWIANGYPLDGTPPAQ